MSSQAALLTISPGPEPEESLLGYILRLSQANSMTKASWLFRLTGLPLADHSVLATYPWDLTGLSHYCGVDPATLAMKAYWPSEQTGFVNFLGNPIREDLVTVRQRRACPACLGDAPFHRAVWDLSLVTVCPLHGRYLISACHRCGRRLDWRAGTLTSCPCGLGQFREAPQTEASGEVVSAAKFAVASTGPGRAGLRDGDQVWLAYQLGWIAAGRDGIGRPINLLACGGDTSAILAAGMGAIQGDFAGFLDRLIAASTSGQAIWRMARVLRHAINYTYGPQNAAWKAEIESRMHRLRSNYG